MNKKSIRIFVCILLLLPLSLKLDGQSYNTEKVAWSNYLIRMYKSAPFEGVRVVDDYDNQYLISVLALDRSKYQDESAMNRVASVKAMSQASRYFNGSKITSDLIIRTNEKSDGTADTEIIETINENSTGFVKALEQLANFPQEGTNKQVFIFSALIASQDK